MLNEFRIIKGVMILLNEEKIIKIQGHLEYNEQFDIKIECIATYIFFFTLLLIISLVGVSITNSLVRDAIACLVITFLGPIPLVAIWKIRRKKMFDSSNMINENIYMINDKGVSRQVRENILFIKWNDIYMISENNNSFKIYIKNKMNNNKAKKIDKNLFHNDFGIVDVDFIEMVNPLSIPKNFFKDEFQISSFKEIVELNIKKDNIKFK